MIREELEEIVLAKLLSKKENYYEHFNLLSNSLFETHFNRQTFDIIDSYFQQGKTVDIMSLVADLKKETGIDCIYQVSVLFSLSTFNYDFVKVVNQIISLNKTKSLEGIVNHLHEVVKKKEGSVEEAISGAIESLTAINEDNVQDLPDIQKQLKDFVTEVETNSKNPGLTGITTGFKEMDDHTGGWKNQDLIIVGGASSMGKTSLALSLAFNAVVSDVPSVVFSYEMSVNQLLTRLVSSNSAIENKSLSSGTLRDNDWTTMHKSIGQMERMPLYIDECNDTSLRYLLNRIRRYVISKKVKLVMIDYLQLVNNFTRGRSREQEVSQIARSLKNIAKELDICVIALSQLSRGVEKRPGCRPTLGDLRESGEIEQAADTVVLVYRPEYYGFTADDNVAGLAEIIFAKGRNVGIGNIFLHFNSKLTKFVDPNMDTNYQKFDE